MNLPELAQELGFDGLAGELADPCQQLLAAAVATTSCSEGTLWLFDPGTASLRPIANSGANAQRLIDGISQPADEGLISMVFASGQPFCENEIRSNPDHSRQVDELLGIETVAMLAVPVAFAEELRGVLSLVHLVKAGRAFDRVDLNSAVTAAAEIACLADTRLDSLLADA